MKAALKSQWCWKGFIFLIWISSVPSTYRTFTSGGQNQNKSLSAKGAIAQHCAHSMIVLWSIQELGFTNLCHVRWSELCFTGRELLLVTYLNHFQTLCIMKYPHPFSHLFFFFALKSQEAICQVTKPFGTNLLPDYWTEMIALQALSQEKGRKLLEERRSWHTFPLLK